MVEIINPWCMCHRNTVIFCVPSIFIYLSVTKLTATNLAYTFKVRHCRVPCLWTLLKMLCSRVTVLFVCHNYRPLSSHDDNRYTNGFWHNCKRHRMWTAIASGDEYLKQSGFFWLTWLQGLMTFISWHQQADKEWELFQWYYFLIVCYSKHNDGYCHIANLAFLYNGGK